MISHGEIVVVFLLVHENGIVPIAVAEKHKYT